MLRSRRLHAVNMSPTFLFMYYNMFFCTQKYPLHISLQHFCRATGISLFRVPYTVFRLSRIYFTSATESRIIRVPLMTLRLGFSPCPAICFCSVSTASMVMASTSTSTVVSFGVEYSPKE